LASALRAAGFCAWSEEVVVNKLSRESGHTALLRTRDSSGAESRAEVMVAIACYTRNAEVLTVCAFCFLAAAAASPRRSLVSRTLLLHLSMPYAGQRAWRL